MSRRPRPGAATRAVVAIAGVGVLLLSACAPGMAAPAASSSATADAPVLDDAIRAQLDEGVAAALEGSGMPGGAVHLSIGDEVWEFSGGVGDASTQEPFDPGAVVRIASVSKTFVATVVLQLASEGMLSLDGTVDAFIPGITGGDRITVRHLLSMSSGVWEFTGDADLMARWSADPVMPWTVDDTVVHIAGKPAQFEPGAKTIYTDSNYILLGRIVEKVTGSSLADQIEERIVTPLGLTSTAMPSAEDTGVPEPHQQGYRPVGDGATGPNVELVPISEINPEIAWAAGSMTSTMSDLVIWAQALADGRLLTEEMQAKRLDSEFMDGSNIEYGLGIQRFGDFIGHGGAIFGYNTTMMRMPERDVTVVIVGNGSSNASGGTLDIFAFLIQTLFPEQLEQ
jgi:D-alanyl-D-alanine carboxypeptidase